MTDFQVMLNWYAPEVEVYEKFCVDCGAKITTDKMHRSVTRCKECAYEKALADDRKGRLPKLDIGDGIMNLVNMMIRNATFEARRGNMEARAWLLDGDAELWLRCAEIDVTDELRARLHQLTEGSDE